MKISMKISLLAVIFGSALLGGCAAGNDESGAGLDGCGDVDGAGTDTGNVPDMAGSWSTQFYYDENNDSCNGISSDTETWIGAMQVQGSVPSLSMYFGTERGDETFYGMVDRNGGVTFSGTHAHPAGTEHAQFGGLAYHDQYLDVDVIDGSLFIGLDGDGDGAIDCTVKGAWIARKSGS